MSNHCFEKFKSSLKILGGYETLPPLSQFEPRGCVFSNGCPDNYYSLLLCEGYGPKKPIRKRNLDKDPDRCLCGVRIKELHFICDWNKKHIWYQVGSCCINRFRGSLRAVCEHCRTPKNLSKYLLCEPCRKASRKVKPSSQSVNFS